MNSSYFLRSFNWEREKQTIEIAKKMKGLGVDDMVISHSTGLSVEEIAALR